MAQAKQPTGLAVIGSEYRALDEIPPRARVFGMWDQAALWFGAASLPAAWLYGAIMAGWTGLGGALLLILGVSPLVLIPWALLGYIAARVGGASVAILRPAFGLRGCAVQGIFAVAGHRAIRLMSWAATIGLAVLGTYETWLALRTWSLVDLLAWRPPTTLATSVGPFSYTITL